MNIQGPDPYDDREHRLEMEDRYRGYDFLQEFKDKVSTLEVQVRRLTKEAVDWNRRYDELLAEYNARLASGNIPEKKSEGGELAQYKNLLETYKKMLKEANDELEHERGRL